MGHAVHTRALPPTPDVGAPADWDDLLRVERIAALAACDQAPKWHAEGNVLIHTQMVVAGLLADPQWQALPEPTRTTMYWAAVLHDIGKPATTRWEGGRWRSPSHARVGAAIAREILWDAGVDPFERERICALVAHHMFAPRAFDPERGEQYSVRRILEVSLTAGCDMLQLLSRNDVTGRIGEGIPESVEAVELYALLCEELGCLEAPFDFPSDHSRYTYFTRGGDPRREVYDDTRSRVWVMSGLPGSGKDHWIQENLSDVEMISLDDMRRAGRVRRNDTKGQGRVVMEAMRRARVLLAAGEPFVWNTTGLSRQLRDKIAGLAGDYKAHVTMVCLDPGKDTVLRQNREREHVVPEAALLRLVGKWEPPTLTECHQLVQVV